MKHLLPGILAAALLGWVTAAPADDPEVPEKYVKVDEAKALFDQKTTVTFIDVRPKEQYDIIHILGALNIPLKDLPTRLADVPKQPLVVLY